MTYTPRALQLCPQNIAFGAQRPQHKLLFRPCAGMLGHPGESELHIFRSLRQPRVEVGQATAQPGIMLPRSPRCLRLRYSLERRGPAKHPKAKRLAPSCKKKTNLDFKPSNSKIDRVP